jgi:hypothetical protein
LTVENITPAKLILKLSAYFLLLISAVILLLLVNSDAIRYLPLGGTDALQETSLEITQSRFDFDSVAGTADHIGGPITPEKIKFVVLFLSASLAGTILIMVPIAWTYSATRLDSGPEKNFVRALIVLPICATTVVLLIQDSLALAFGLAALVAAVRFRVSLNEAIDGIYIFAAVCVGLAAGIGYLGVAAVMALFFCMTNAVLWHLDYGKNPIDEVRRKAKQDKFKNLN